MLAGGCRSPGVRSTPAQAALQAPALIPNALTLAPGIHMLGSCSPSAVYAVETDSGLVLIDSGKEADARVVKADLSKVGLDWRRVRAILLTHAHGDHTGGAAHIRARTGARVYAGKGDAATIRTGEPEEAVFATLVVPGMEARRTPVDVGLRGGEAVRIGGAVFQALAAPGHSPGSICYVLERDGRRVLFAGDVLLCLNGNVQQVDPAMRSPFGTYVAYRAPRYRGSADAYLSTLRKLREMPPPDLVLPGHPRMDPEPQRPTFSAERWRSLMDEGIGELQALLERYARDGADFLDGQPKELEPGLYYLGDLGGRALYALYLNQKLLLVDAPGGPELPDVVAGALSRLRVPARTPAAILLTSADHTAISGLRSLLKRWRAAVVVPPEGREAVRADSRTAVRILTPEELRRAFGVEVGAVPLGGRGKAPVGYIATVRGKTVLLSGRIPARPDQPSMVALLADLRREGSGGSFLAAVARLGKLKPDLWLPAQPSYGQNANLYAGEWENMVIRNLAAMSGGVPE